MGNQVIKVLIADDHDLIREGLKRIISFEEDLKVIGEAQNGEHAIKLVSEYKPDVVLLDLNMPVMSGIEALEQLKKQDDKIKFIMLTVEKDSNTIHAAIEIGADGYILKDSAGTEIVSAIRAVYNDERYIDKSLVSLLFSDIKCHDKKSTSILDCLSKREIEVLIKISMGFSNKEIGKELFLSEKTIKNYATNIFRKINVTDRVHATILALGSGIDEYYKSKFN